MQLAPGVQVADHIRLMRQLGEGGMGSIWEAEHQNLNATVAVKILSTDATQQSRTMVARFKREALAASRINSPHVVKMFDSGVLFDGTPYLVMELLEGQDLAERIEVGGPLAFTELTHIVDQVGKALSKAHAEGIVHRDVKPDNVFLLDEDGDVFVKVLDFGIAKQFDVKSHSVVTMTGTMVGTPAYMSPEQVLSGKDVDFRSDIWSLGVLVYHALSGDIPFKGETLGGMCVSIANGQYTPITQLRPDVPSGLDDWFTHTLAVGPYDRFESVQAAAAALRKLTVDDDAASIAKTVLMSRMKPPPPSFTTSIHLPMRGPSRRLVAAVALVSVAVGAAIALPIMLADDDNDREASRDETSAPAHDQSAATPSTPPKTSAVPRASVSTAHHQASVMTTPPPRRTATTAPLPVPPAPLDPPKAGPVDRGF